MNPINPGYRRNDDPFLRKRRTRRIVTALVLLVALAGLGVAAPMAFKALAAGAGAGKPTRRETIALWEAKDYGALMKACDSALSADPLDTFFLTFRGFASFYLSAQSPDADERATLIDETIVALRKALVDEKAALEPQARYVLGKAYYFKGLDYYDESLAELEASVASGYAPADAWEYLALAAQGTGQTRRSLAFFDEAMGRFPDSPELTLAAARAYFDAGEYPKAESLALSAGQSTDDAFLDERSDFILGDIYRTTKRYDEALLRYASIKERNPESADAWYFEGLVLADTGDAIGARAAWRKAISIDPMHALARQKLAERS